MGVAIVRYTSCEEGPVASDATLVGSYRFFGGDE
jgi:hypothetical protein